jgi:hypothetical protein
MRLLMFTCVVHLAVAQEIAFPSDSPIRISIQSNASSKGSLRLDLTNVSQKDIVAYAVVASERSTGKPRTMTRGVRSSSLDPTPFAIGKRWTAGLPQVFDTEAKLMDSVISVDYVRFADGSDWGPDLMKQSLEIQGRLAGESVTRERFRRMIEESGPEAVISEIRKIPAPQKARPKARQGLNKH